MHSPEDLKRRQEIQSSLKSIVETSDSWLGQIRKREFRVRLATSFLTVVMGFFAIIAVVLGSLVARNGIGYFQTLVQQHVVQIGAAALVALLGAIISGVVAYYLLKRNDEARLRELSTLVAQMKKKIAEEDQAEKSSAPIEGEGITESALSMADKILTLLPELVRRRNQDSILYGIVAFILTGFIGRNFPAAILVGVIVWIYFRYEMRKSYDQEIAKIDEQKRVLEQRKQDFLATL